MYDNGGRDDGHSCDDVPHGDDDGRGDACDDFCDGDSNDDASSADGDAREGDDALHDVCADQHESQKLGDHYSD